MHNPRKRHYPRNKEKFVKKATYPKIKPGSAPQLKKIFKQIGVPDASPFTPDSFQLESLEVIKTADCLVTAPTGSGKTWIAQQVIEDVFARGEKAWYASPLKALSNAIYAAFKKHFGEDAVGILTGDRRENSEAPIIIGTTEILRNQLYDAMHQGEDLPTDLIILDEAHFLGDEDRGVVWEEILIYLPVRTPILMLSATIGNAHEIADWLTQIRSRKCIVVEETKRSVPLEPLFFHPSGTLFPFVSHSDARGKSRIHKQVAAYLQHRHPLRMAPPGKLPPMGHILKVLRKFHLLPAIFFLKSRQDCDNALELCTEEALLDDPERKLRLSARIAALMEKYPHIGKARQLRQLEHLGVGAHHSGQLPGWKIIVEILMSEGLLDAVFATSTVAAGVNFPARTVVILNSDRFNGREFVSLNPTEFHQMTGRAGRRGMDKIGFAVMLPGKFMDLRLVAKLINAAPSPVHSQIRINFSMVLNLLLSHSPDQIEAMLTRSFAAYLLNKRKKRSQQIFFSDHNYLWQDFTQHLNFLKETGYVTDAETLSDDGRWAAQLRIDQPLMIAEGLRLGIFPDGDPAILAAIMAAFVNERESDDGMVNHDIIPKRLLSAFLHIKKRLRPFARKMAREGFDVRTLYLRPAVTICIWALGMPWEEVVEAAEIAEGDLARLILMTADNLRHFKNLAGEFPGIAEASVRSIGMILKEPVTSYYSA